MLIVTYNKTRYWELKIMVEIGYKLSSEDTHPINLVNYAKMAEDAGFSFAMISDHYHPWISKQNESPFVWSTLGGITQTTNNLNIGTAVTCPTIRVHPAIIAQAAATTASLMDGRFILGVGSGENLNEHILGDHWPPAPIRIEMLEEAIYIIRMLWQGGMHNFKGKYYTIQNTQIYTLPSHLPPILMSADGELAAETAGRIADGLITPGIRKNIVNIFKKNGGGNKPCYAEASVCWANNEDNAKKIAYKYWPILSNKNGLNWEIQTPKYFEELAKMNDPETLAREIACGDDPQRHIDEIKEFIKAGYNHVFVHQLGPEQEGFINFYKEEVLPAFK
jgi:coenzyme F420-dependent glucose-6-phosphate dehydrogenase